MECKECYGLLVAYVKGELPEPDAKLVEQHIAGCESCQWNEQAARRMLEEMREAEGGPIKSFARTIIERAIQERASDIHIEPDAEPKPPTDNLGDPFLDAEANTSVRIRFRIDGVLHDIFRLPRYVCSPLATHFMVLSEMNPFERRIPQSGRIHIRHAKRDYDLRAQTVPTTRGMRVVLRIFDKSFVLLDLGQLGLSETNLARVQEASVRPYGLFLIAGPAGGGRTTFAYSMLSALTRPAISILTIEDPVEVQLPGVSQTHVNRKAGMDYAEALKAMMRQDPDIILCADVPDTTVANLLGHIAVTGHLVLAPVIGNDAADGLKRFLDLTTEPLTTGKALIGVAGMRLVRKVCGDCAQDADPSAADVEFLRRAGIEEAPAKLKRNVGCGTCRQTGYRGRIGIHEVLLIDEELREKIRQSRVEETDIRAAISPSMLRDAGEKVIAGITTAEEAERVASAASIG
ncbi:MAG: type II secretion system protein GspE [Armatimonadetes bacterium]|nr:type II secretion system protein GspE [Armatimonadota bacterium]